MAQRDELEQKRERMTSWIERNTKQAWLLLGKKENGRTGRATMLLDRGVENCNDISSGNREREREQSQADDDDGHYRGRS